MRKFLKNFFSQKNSLSKQKILTIGLFVFLISFLLFRASPVQAINWLWLPEKIAQAISALVLTVLLALAQAILKLGIVFFNWSLNGIPVSYTDPARNELIRIGWTLIRDITNMAFILGLVYIGLATALRFAGFQVKRVFAWFLIMALLVNFTPVICGVIVDGANLLMNFFLKGPGGWEMLNSLFDEQRAIVAQYIRGPADWPLFFKMAVLVSFGLIAGLVFLLYGILFLARNVVIWILVIFSPLAFFAYIFPRTRTWIFEKWWHQFFQWTIIGAIAGFFLYLAQYTLLLAHRGELALGGTPEPVFNELAPYIVALVFLIIGFFTSTMTSAMGATQIMGFAKTKGKAAVKWGGRQAKKAAKVTAAAAGAATIGALRGAKEEKGLWSRIKGALKGAATWEGRERGREWAEKFLERMHLVRPGFYEERRKKRWKIDEAIKRLEKLPTNRLNAFLKRKLLTAEDVTAKIAAFEVLAKRRSLGGDIRTKEGREKEEAMRKVIPLAITYGVDLSEMLKARPDLAPEVGKTIEEVVKEKSPRAFTRETQPEALTPDVLEAMDLSKVTHLAEYGTTQQKRALVEAPFTPIGKAKTEGFRWAETHRVLSDEEKERIRRWRDNLRVIETDPNLRKFLETIPGVRRRIPGIAVEIKK